MSDASTVHLIEMYVNEATPVPFLTNFFQTPERNFHTSEKVGLDIIRDEEEIAVVVQNITTGTRENELDYYVTKEFTPPVFDESATISAFQLMEKNPGEINFQDPDYNVNAALHSFRIMRKLEAKIRRAVELMASQVLTTGKLTLTDNAGRSMYTLDYGPRVTHFPTVAGNWGGGAEDKIGEIAALAEAIRRDGRQTPRTIIFGKRAWRAFFKDPAVIELFKYPKLNMGAITPQYRGGGQSFKGNVVIDNYEYELYTYDATYVDPQTRLVKEYLDQDMVVIIGENARLDLTFGAIPRIGEPQGRALTFLPPRISNGDRRVDVTPNAWITPDGKFLKVSAGTRPLTIPTAIDSFGALKTRV